jgi:hypothetical protein
VKPGDRIRVVSHFGGMFGKVGTLVQIGTSSGDMGHCVIDIDGDTSGWFDNGKHWIPLRYIEPEHG